MKPTPNRGTAAPRPTPPSLHTRPYAWGPLDRAPYDALHLRAAELVGIGPDELKAGEALMHRAPAVMLDAWKAGLIGTPAAYALLTAWELGQLNPVVAQALGLPERGAS